MKYFGSRSSQKILGSAGKTPKILAENRTAWQPRSQPSTHQNISLGFNAGVASPDSHHCYKFLQIASQCWARASDWPSPGHASGKNQGEGMFMPTFGFLALGILALPPTNICIGKKSSKQKIVHQERQKLTHPLL